MHTGSKPSLALTISALLRSITLGHECRAILNVSRGIHKKQGLILILLEISREALSYATPEELEFLETQLRLEIALMSPADLAEYCDPTFERPRHIEYMNKLIVAAFSGRLKKFGKLCRRLMIQMPPRHGKSTFANKWLSAWLILKFPDKKVISAAHTSEFAADWGREVRNVIAEHPEFGVILAKDSKAADKWNIQGHKGGMVTSGTNTGKLTGKGGHALVVDDLFGDPTEADSPVIKDAKWKWYESVFKSRKEPGAVEVHIGTKWSNDDVDGRIEEKHADKWIIIRFPAIAMESDILGREPGEALWPNRFSVEYLIDEFRDEIDPRWWAAQFQQTPILGETMLFNEDEFNYFDIFRKDDTSYYRLTIPTVDGHINKEIAEDKCWYFASMDTAATTKTTSDYTVIATWAVTPDKEILLVDLVRKRVLSHEHRPMVDHAIAAYPLRFILVEPVTFGLTLIQGLQHLGYKVLEAEGIDTDKYSRAVQASIYVRTNTMFFPAKSPFMNEYIKELTEFNLGAHDDQVDVTSIAAHELVRHHKRKRDKKIEKEDNSVEKRIHDQVFGKKKKGGAVHGILGRF
jgi:predicted phage terminase large subunit-like protein